MESNTTIHLQTGVQTGYYPPGTPVERLTPVLRFADVGAIDDGVVQGVSDAVGVQAGHLGRWLRAALPTPFPDAPLTHDLALRHLKLKVRASGQRPDLAFANTAPVDTTKDFKPFGDRPQAGDAFYLGHEETFAKTGAEVSLHFQAGELPPRQLV